MVDGGKSMPSNGFLCVYMLFPSVSDITVTLFDFFFSAFKNLVAQIFQPRLRKFAVETPKKPSRQIHIFHKHIVTLHGSKKIYSHVASYLFETWQKDSGKNC